MANKGGTRGEGTRMMWKHKERDAVVARAVQLRRSEKELSLLDSLYRAQGEVLPPERQKKELGWYLKPALIKRVLAEEKDPNPPYVHPKDPMLLVSEPVKASTPAGVEPAPAAPAAPLPESILTSLGRELGAAFGAAFAAQLAPALHDALKNLFAAKPNGNGNGNGAHRASLDHIMAMLAQHGPSGAPQDFGNLPEKFHTHKVAVIGLLGSQQNTIKQSFPHLDFRWVDGGAKGETVKNVTKQCEAAFVMTKFVRHQSFNSVPMDKRVPCNGGVSDLTRLLMSRYPRSTSMEAKAH